MIALPHALVMPLRIALGEFVGRFHRQLQADTPALVEFRDREFRRAALYAPSRMIDQIESMLTAWRTNDSGTGTSGADSLPVLVVAIGADYSPVPADAGGRPVADPVEVIIPSDPKRRVFELRAVQADVRAQIAICAADPMTAQSLAMQLHLFLSETPNRYFRAKYMLAGMIESWPVQIESPDIIAVRTPTGAGNITILAADLQLRATIPLLRAPRMSDADADGQGTDDLMDPSGYAHLVRVEGQGDVAAWVRSSA